MTEDLWLDISKVAHALATRHDTASYYRPQYITLLLDSLLEPDFTRLGRVIADDLFAAIEAQCGTSICASDRDMFWSAFGVERCAPGVEVLQRSRAARGLDAFLAGSSLPPSLVERVRTLQEAQNPFAVRVLQMHPPQITARLYRNPLDAYRSLYALCEWRLAKESKEVEILQNWIGNVIYHQVWYRVVISQIDRGAVEDVSQDVTLRTLEQLAIYQPQRRTSLSNWTFNMVNQSISMAGRSLRRERNTVAFFTTNPDRLGPPGMSSDEAAEVDAAELVEYAMTRLRASGSYLNIGERIRTFVAAIPHLLGGEPPQTLEELEAQLRVLLPNIDSEHLHRIAVHSGFIPNPTKGSS